MTATPARQAWLLASRPRTLPAAVAPVFVGSALAVQAGKFYWPAALAALFVAIALQIAANFANDLGDFQRGADVPGRVGPTRATSAGLISPGAMSLGMWLTFGAAAAAGLYLVWRGGWPALLVGAASILAGLAYTLGPFPLGYYGLGDLAVFIFFGLVGVVGTYYVQALDITALSVVAAIPVGRAGHGDPGGEQYPRRRYGSGDRQAHPRGAVGAARRTPRVLDFAGRCLSYAGRVVAVVRSGGMDSAALVDVAARSGPHAAGVHGSGATAQQGIGRHGATGRAILCPAGAGDYIALM